MAPKLDPSSDVHSLALTIRGLQRPGTGARVLRPDRPRRQGQEFQDAGRSAARRSALRSWTSSVFTGTGRRASRATNWWSTSLSVCGSPLALRLRSGRTDEYDYALTAIPGEALQVPLREVRRPAAGGQRPLVPERQGQGRERRHPEHASHRARTLHGLQQRHRAGGRRDAAWARPPMASPGIAWLKGMQIVNGGQTTASLYFAKKKFPETDLSR